MVPQSVIESAELEQDCSDDIGHWMCAKCNGEPVMGHVYPTLCGMQKRYSGPKWHLPYCVVCYELRKMPCKGGH